MTTGRKGRFRTPWGTIHFTHTERSSEGILDGTVDVGRPLRWAKPRTALEDLRRTRRNLELVDIDLVEEIEQEMGLPPRTMMKNGPLPSGAVCRGGRTGEVQFCPATGRQVNAASGANRHGRHRRHVVAG